MKQLMKAIRAVLAAMAAMVWVVVRISDRLISVLRPAPMPMIDQLEAEPIGERVTDHTGSVHASIRNLAYCRLEDRMPTPAMLAAAGRLGTEWISVMPKPMLKSVLLADDVKLTRHLRGIEHVKGVLPCDEEVIDQYRIATLRQQAAEEAARRTLTPLRYA